MFYILVRDANGKMSAWGASQGYDTRLAAINAAEDCFGEYYIGEGTTRSEAYQRIKFEIAQKYKNTDVAHRNVRGVS